MRADANAHARFAFDLGLKRVRPRRAATEGHRRHAHDQIIGRTGHDAAHRVDDVVTDHVDASHERFIADRLRVRREDAAVMVGYASRSHHLEIRLHHRVGRRSDDAEFAPPSEHVPHSRSSRTGNTSKRDELAPPHSITSFACAKRWRNRYAKGLSRLGVDHQLEFGRSLHWHIGWLRAPQNLIHYFCSASAQVWDIYTVSQETACCSVFRQTVHCREPGTQRQTVNVRFVGRHNGVSTDVEGICAPFERFDRGINILRAMQFRHDDFKTERASRRLYFVHLRLNATNTSNIAQNSQPAQARDDFTQECEALASGTGHFKR